MWFRWISNKIFGMFQEEEYNKSWDELLMCMIKEPDVVEFSEHTISFKLNNKTYTIWTANKFYAYGHLYCIDGDEIEVSLRFRPTYKVIL